MSYCIMVYVRNQKCSTFTRETGTQPVEYGIAAGNRMAGLSSTYEKSNRNESDRIESHRIASNRMEWNRKERKRIEQLQI